MGVMLSTPITEKSTERGESDLVSWGVSSMQGYRVQMEDRHAAFTAAPGDPSAAFFAVYDGHSGRAAADYCAEKNHGNVINNQFYAEKKYKEAFEHGFLKTDHDFIENDKEAGTTAVALLIKDGQLWCSNAGDSRCIISERKVAVPLSIDQKPGNEIEKKRIYAAGSVVTFDRVDGELAVARAVGDARFKQAVGIPLKDQAVSAFPEVKTHPLTPDVEFALLCCDGVWDVLSNQEAVTYVHDRLKETRDIGRICEMLADHALEKGSKDNITTLLLVFKHYLSTLPDPVPAPPPPQPVEGAETAGAHEDMDRMD